MPFVDSHCHLSTPELRVDWSQIRAQMQAADVQCALNVCTAWADIDAVCAFAAASPSAPTIWASVGVHPEEQGGFEPSVEDLCRAAQHPRVVAVGETGLDFYRPDGADFQITDPAVQRKRFRVHIRAARRLKLPLIIHTRCSFAETVDVLRDENRHDAGALNGVFHCFTEDTAAARVALDLGFYISFSGIVTFKNARTVQETARFVPADRLLIETDSPYLAPVPFRGRCNTPALVPHVAAKLAELRGTSVESIAAITADNFTQLFTKTGNTSGH